jgi:protein-disulfide isomerase
LHRPGEPPIIRPARNVSTELDRSIMRRPWLRFLATVLIAATVGAIAASGTIYLIAREMLGPDAMRAVVKAALMAEPTMVNEALDAADRLQHQQLSAARSQAIETLAGRIYDNAGTPSIGKPDASVTIVEFFDYRCPYCKRVAPEMAALLAEDSDIRVVYKEFPILSPESLYAAKAALAANLQGKYRPMHDALIGLKGNLDNAAVLRAAEEIGLDVAKLQQDMESAAVMDELRSVHDLATALAIDGTPTFLFGNQYVSGALSVDEMRDLVAKLRQS